MKPIGTAAAGLAGVVPDRREAEGAAHPEQGPQGPLSRPPAGLDRRPRRPRRGDEHVAASKTRLKRAASRSAAWWRGGRPPRVGGAEAAEPARSALEPLGMRHRLDIVADAAQVAGDEVVGGEP